MNGRWQVVPDEDDEEDARKSRSADLRRFGGLAVVMLIVAASTASMLDRSSLVLFPRLGHTGCTPQGVSNPTGPMNFARAGHTATLLRSGKVLVAGGWDGQMQIATASAELYDPTTGTWSVSGSMKSARALHAAVLLPSGKVLVAGGRVAVPSARTPSYESMASAELYDPDKGSWTETGGMRAGRDSFAAIVLQSGKVFATPGSSFIGDATSAYELYDPASGSWSAIGGSVVPFGSATLIASGKVLVIAGGVVGAQLYDPPLNAWRPTDNMITPRDRYTATLLPSGKVLAAGGHDFQASYSAVSVAEIYDPARGAWTRTTSMTAQHEGADATSLPSGMVVVAGGGTSLEIGAVDSVDLYDPATESWRASGVMAVARSYFTATLLRSGALLFAGGDGPFRGGPHASAEIYTVTCNLR